MSFFLIGFDPRQQGPTLGLFSILQCGVLSFDFLFELLLGFSGVSFGEVLLVDGASFEGEADGGGGFGFEQFGQRGD
jgi:hypothetical protein